MNEPVLTLTDLSAWPRPGTHLAVLGYPIKHSISPPMHNAALTELAKADPQFAAWRYHRFEVPPDELPAALDKLLAAGFRGLNLTVPHKVIAFDKVNTVGSAASPIGAVNTLVNEGGAWSGYNTDGYGLRRSILSELGLMFAGSDVLLLGAGGAARGAAVECLQNSVRSLRIVNRTATSRDALLHQLAPLANGIPIHGIDPAHLPSDLPAGLLVINATSVGLRPADAPPINLAALPRPSAVFDMIYNPAETALLAKARELDIPAANGLGMLVHQGARSLQHWIETVTGQPAPPIPVEVMRRAAEAVLAAP